MAIDNPMDQYEQYYMKEEPSLPGNLARYMGEQGLKLAFPENGFARGILLKVLDVLFNKESVSERNRVMWEMIRGEFDQVEATKANHDDVQKAIQFAFWYDRHERNDAKRERYVRLIGNALRSDEQVQDVASFIQTVEQLNERDITVLKVVNRIMNKAGDWQAQPNPGIGNVMKLHPAVLAGRAQELTVQIAIAIGQATEDNQYSREHGYAICNRLQGFGLVHEIETTRELPLTNYTFRLSVYGIRLLKLLGEEVQNYEHYVKL
ncbi:MAG: hypothetical protein JST79_13060 [Acidobacteria bacterium]|nr:hypothetical protein [Acidobacteriota bacterium]